MKVTDQFCGAGGSGQGIKKALEKNGGGELTLALNHWKLATETYATNNPNTKVDCTDVSACDPRRYPTTDGLCTSPECTTHSPAGGNNHKTLKKQMDMFNANPVAAATERSRATMWDVCRFAEYHKYNFIVVENVVEAKTRWQLFDVWLTAMHTLGYNHKCVYRNSMHHYPTPQSRDRMYVVFWKKGNKAPDLEYTPQAFCSCCSKNVESIQTWKNPKKQFGKYRQQYVYCCPTCTNVVEPYYYAAMNVIDWSNPGTRIRDRKKALAPATMRRIQYGHDKYGKKLMVLNRAYGPEARGVIRTVDKPLFTQTSVDSQAIINPYHSMGLVAPPYIIKLEHSNHSATAANQPMPTQTCTDGIGFVAPPPFITTQKNTSNAKCGTDPLTTQTTVASHGLVTTESWNSFISYYYGESQASHITQPLNTLRTTDCHQLITYEAEQKHFDIEDYYYRMLSPYEVKLGMAFDPNYKILGTGKDQVKQCGNAVTPPVMEWLVDRCIKSFI